MTTATLDKLDLYHLGQGIGMLVYIQEWMITTA
jgi:hypothetical protein